MSMVHTRQMGRLVAAGMLENLDDTINLLSQIRALHIVDYDGSEDGQGSTKSRRFINRRC